jgi:hypothetical protein
MKIRKILVLIFFLIESQQGNIFAQQYCELGVYGSGCQPNDNINSVSINGTSLNVSGNYCTNLFSLNVTVFPDTGSATCNLVQGQSYLLNVSSTSSSAIGFWIDYNHNFNFEVSEYQQITSNSVANTAATLLFTVQSYPYFGKTRMRIRSRNSSFTGADACVPFGSGETEDYTVFIEAAALCSNPLNTGIAISSAGDSLCPGTETVLSIQGNSVAGGISYQWESSLDSLIWNPLPGGGSFSDTIFVYNSAYYRCAQTCAGQTSYSASAFIKLKSVFSCYCSSAPSFPIAFNTNSHIGNVKLSNLNNGGDSLNFNVPLATGSYSDFSNLPATNLVQGMAYPMRVVVINNSVSSFKNSLLSGFIDYNQNGIFEEPYEKIISEASIAGKFVFLPIVNVPSTAALGLTKMRLVVYNENYYKSGACFAYGTGETEDYSVNIVQGSSCISPITAGFTEASFGPKICAGNKSILSLNGASTGSSLLYQWQFSLDSINWYNLQNANWPSFQDSVEISKYYRCRLTCGSNSVFSVPYKLNVLPSTQCYCSAVSNLSRYHGASIGRFSFGSLSNGLDSLPVLSNPTSMDVYSNFTNLPIPSYSKGSTYSSRVNQISSNSLFASSSVRIFIDYDRDGTFNNSNEIALQGATSNSGIGSIVTGLINIPTTAQIGITGLRVALIEGIGANPPCANFYNGEVEDYLIYIDFPTHTQQDVNPDYFSIYPNPVYEMASITFANPLNHKLEMRIYELNGQLQEIINLPINQSTFSLSTSNYKAGVYALALYKDGVQIKVKKMCVIK